LTVVVRAVLVGMTFASSVAVGVGGYLNARSGLQNAVTGELAMIAETRKALLETKLSGLVSDLSTLATSAAASLAFGEPSRNMAGIDLHREELTAYFRPAGADFSARAELTGEDNNNKYRWRPNTYVEKAGEFSSQASYFDKEVRQFLLQVLRN